MMLTAPQLPHFLPVPEMLVPHLGQLLWPMLRLIGWCLDGVVDVLRFGVV